MVGLSLIDVVLVYLVKGTRSVPYAGVNTDV